MEKLQKHIATLEELKQKLLRISITAEQRENVTRELIEIKAKIKDESPELSEAINKCIMLNDYLKSDIQKFRNNFIEITTVVASIKIDSISKIQELQAKLDKLSQTQTKKEKKPVFHIFGQEIKIKDIFTYILIILLTIYTMFVLNPEAAEKTIDSFNKTTKTIKGDK